MDANQLLDPLTPRELEILRLLFAGHTTREVAAILFLTDGTVRWYVKQIYSKLGVHNRTQAILQAQARGLFNTPSDVAAGRAPPHSSNNLPQQASSFIGRDNDIDYVIHLLLEANCRILTLVGAGGVGKTRLAIEVASRVGDRYPDGVAFVSLQSIDNPALLDYVLADALKLSLSGQDKPRDQLIRFLHSKHLLMILDNFEQLSDGSELLAELVSNASQLQLLVTSRQALKLRSEWLYPLGGLDVPPPGAPDDETDSYSAVRLFAERATRVQPDFSLVDERHEVVRLVRLLEGVPLAIELAADWTRTLSCEEILIEIGRNLDFLTTRMKDVPRRHHSMRLVIEHSYARLSPEEQKVLNDLSVFAGGAHRAAVEQVAQTSIQTLASLVDKSILRRAPNGQYSLHELVRKFAEGELNRSAENTRQARDRHCSYYAGFAHDQSLRLMSSEQLAALDEMEAELANILAAWRYMVETGRTTGIQLMVHGLSRYLDYRGRHQQAIELLDRAVAQLRALADEANAQIALGQVLGHQAWFCVATGNPAKARTLAEESLQRLRQWDRPVEMMMALPSFVRACSYLNAWEDAEAAALEGLELARKRGDRWHIAIFLYWCGQCARTRQDFDRAKQLGEEGLKIAEHTGDRWSIGSLSGLLLGTVALQQEDFAEAQRHFERGLELYREIGQPWPIGVTLGHLGDVAFAMNDLRRAKQRYLERLALFAATTGHLWEVVRTLYSLARLLKAEGDPIRAVELLSGYWHHPATLDIHRQQAETLSTELRAELSPDVFEKAWEAGSALKLEDVVRELTGNPNQL